MMNERYGKIIGLFIFIVVAVTLASGVASAMNIFKNDFERRWSDLSKDVNKLNEYSKTHPVELRDVKAENLDIEGVIFVGATFSGVEWYAVDASKAILTKVLFRKCKFVGGKWKDSIMTDVIFEDCEFTDTSLSGSTMVKVRFKNCKIDQTGIAYLKGGKVEFNECHWDTGAGGDSSCEFVFKNCTLGGISFSMMKNGVPILFEDCLLDEIDFYGSHFSDVILRRVRQGEGPTRFNSATAKSFRFEDVDMTRGVSLAHVIAESVTIAGGTFRGATEGSTIAKVYAHDANLFMYDMSEAVMPDVKIWNCKIQDLAIWECFIEELSFSNSTVHGIDATDFKADIVVWDNVTLDGKIDLTNAQIKDFRPTRLTRGPRLQLITTGSNVRF
jgi:uncharacterized protein YjbI with pentapeptide repeats